MAVKNFAVGLAIAIMLPFAVHYGVITFSPAAKYYCVSKKDFVKLQVGTEDSKALTPEQTVLKATLEAEYDEGHKRFSKHLFFVAVPAGILLIATGLVVLVPGIDSGLMFGGLFTLMYGYFTYWSDLPIAVRFVSLVGGLALFIIIGVVKHGKKTAA
jgi:hypothetical protein